VHLAAAAVHQQQSQQQQQQQRRQSRSLRALGYLPGLITSWTVSGAVHTLLSANDFSIAAPLIDAPDASQLDNFSACMCVRYC
jgi:hypothetical protein